ncbi:hypothetical protein P170DRAFT_426657 [Aspergillus steynii IBT 23096]|uniref:Uncharacterized protein n=1 Tax=Aspergillus steynii IBT 23096 TaxID=1392250 RepID=A0A2I2GA93_9EURO|nr:uncharacterized protein P170DRAFT_426657 [Aspergillus steynii IBT 23096]PLB49791.1 hypothetical protein P170DRAFT_426657 [Aspergillus steynii IBT 23096]
MSGKPRQLIPQVGEYLSAVVFSFPEMPMILGGSRHIVVHFSQSVAVDQITVLKLVLAKLKAGDFKWSLRKPCHDYYTYHFEVEVPATVEEDEECKNAAIDFVSRRLEDAQHLGGKRQGKSSVKDAREKDNVARVKAKMYSKVPPPGPSEPAPPVQSMVDESLLDEEERRKKQEEWYWGFLEAESVDSSLDGLFDVEEIQSDLCFGSCSG